MARDEALTVLILRPDGLLLTSKYYDTVSFTACRARSFTRKTKKTLTSRDHRHQVFPRRAQQTRASDDDILYLD